VITDAERARLAAILGMLGSDHAGERDNAARLAEHFRREWGMTWDDLFKERERVVVEERVIYRDRIVEKPTPYYEFTGKVTGTFAEQLAAHLRASGWSVKPPRSSRHSNLSWWGRLRLNWSWRPSESPLAAFVYSVVFLATVIGLAWTNADRSICLNQHIRPGVGAGWQAREIYNRSLSQPDHPCP
jgi:hypothetical protein